MDFKEYFSHINLTKIPMKGLHYEQKTTPDLIWCVALVICEITKQNRNSVFSDKEIRNSQLYNELMQDYFSKAPQHLAGSEYNKLSSYQLGLLVYAGVLEEVGGSPKKYRISQPDIIEYISGNDLHASRFLTEYTEKFLLDNDLILSFEIYENNPNQTNYLAIKDKYWEWAKANTNIRGTDRKHTYRVVNKIFNVYCYKHRIPGEERSKISDGPCPYSLLIYNRKNFRDEAMPSGMTRREYVEKVLLDIDTQGVVCVAQIQKAKADIKRKYRGESEIQDPKYGFIPNGGVHIHHILPQSSYSHFARYRENLIALTPGQHLSLAHPQTNTQRINADFQRICLEKKFEHIKESLAQGEDFYVLSKFIEVLNSALSLTISESADISEINTFV